MLSEVWRHCQTPSEKTDATWKLRRICFTSYCTDLATSYTRECHGLSQQWCFEIRTARNIYELYIYNPCWVHGLWLLGYSLHKDCTDCRTCMYSRIGLLGNASQNAKFVSSSFLKERPIKSQNGPEQLQVHTENQHSNVRSPCQHDQ